MSKTITMIKNRRVKVLGISSIERFVKGVRAFSTCWKYSVYLKSCFQRILMWALSHKIINVFTWSLRISILFAKHLEAIPDCWKSGNRSDRRTSISIGSHCSCLKILFMEYYSYREWNITHGSEKKKEVTGSSLGNTFHLIGLVILVHIDCCDCQMSIRMRIYGRNGGHRKRHGMRRICKYPGHYPISKSNKIYLSGVNVWWGWLWIHL